jgi:hypothetical protein
MRDCATARGVDLLRRHAVDALNRVDHSRHATLSQAALFEQPAMSFGAEQPLVFVIGVANGEFLGELRVAHQMSMMHSILRVDGKGRVADPLAARVDAVAGNATR